MVAPNARGVDVARLRRAKDWSHKRMRGLRMNRQSAIRQMVGQWYVDVGGQKEGDAVPLNLINLLVEVLASHLVLGAPRALISTPHLELVGQAEDMQAAIEWDLERQDWETTARLLVIDAIYLLGMMKLGLVPGGEVYDLEGATFDNGLASLDRISLQDAVVDAGARQWGEVQYIGNRYLLSLEEAKHSGLFHPGPAGKLKAQTPKTDDRPERRRDEGLLAGSMLEPGECRYADEVEIWDIYLTRERLLVSIAEDPSIDEPLRVIEWSGPPDRWLGPYHTLTLGTPVPDELFPVAPISSTRDLHELMNTIFRKIGRQARDQKTILGIPNDGDEDGKAIKKAKDGEIVKMRNPEQFREYRFNGADQQSLALLFQLRQLWNYSAGNPDALGGLQPQADTLGQDQMLLSQATGRVRSMARMIAHFTRAVYRDLAWWHLDDPVSSRRMSRRVPQLGVEVPVVWSPDYRATIDFLQFNFEIDPYYEADRTPSGRAKNIIQQFQVLLPMLTPLMDAQGAQLDVQGTFRVLSRLLGIDELEQLIIFMDEPRVPPGGVQEPRQSPVTTRRNIRENRSTRTMEGAEHDMIQSLLSGSGEPSMAGAV